MRKKLLIIFMVMIIMITYGCQKTVLNEDVDNDILLIEETIEVDNEITLIDETIEVVKMPSTKQRDEMVTEVLETAFTVKEDDYNYEFIDYSYYNEAKYEQVEPLFTEKGFKRAKNSSMMAGLMFVYGEYYCTSVLENLELEFRETSNSDQLVCYYKFNLIVSFDESSVKPFEDEVFGELTLQVVGDDWKVDFLSISSGYSFRRNFNKYTEASNIDNSENQILDSLMIEIINELSSNSSNFQVQNIEEDSYIIVFENSQIKCGQKDGEFFSIVNVDGFDYNLEEHSVLLHITSEVDFNYDVGNQKIIEVDYFDKIIINESGITYIYKYDSDEMKESQWHYLKE